ncbi:hypothetical protein OAE22_00480 [bacterium]|nr:hypothetical protein [bacterium]
MSELFIMRHGKAEDASSHTGYADRPRRLTPEGIANIQAMMPALPSSCRDSTHHTSGTQSHS